MLWLPVCAALMVAQSQDYSAEGMKALEAQRYADAATSFAKAVEGDPKDYAAHFHLALSLSMLKRDGDAIAEYRKVLELKPGLPEAELNLGILLLRDKRPKDALPHLSAAAEKKKQFRSVFYWAQALYDTEDFRAAEEQYSAAADLDPKSADAQAGWARALTKQSRLDDAASHYRKAVELDPAFRDLLLELAAQYEAKRRTDEAVAIYREFPDNPVARERLGELLLEGGKAAEAIPDLEVAVAKSPTSANRVALATAYLRSKQFDKAVPLLQQATAAEPGNLDLRMMLGRTLRDQKNYRAAAQEFYRVTQAQPDSKEAWSELAGMLILLENYPQALAALDKLQSLGVENAGQYFFRAIVLDRTRQYKPALEAYTKFLSMSQGQNANEEFQARQRIRVIQKELSKH